MASARKKALMDIFKGPSDDEEFLGFKNASSEGFSEESRDSLRSQNSWKPESRFRSKFITNELARVFMDTDGEDEFEGFSEGEDSVHDTWMSPVEPEDSDDIGFYSDDETPAPPQRRASGLCVAFKFPGKSSTRGNKVRTKSTRPSVSHPHGRASQKRRAVLTAAPASANNAKVIRRGMSSDGSEEEEDDHVLSQRNRNIQENKAMLAKLFADLSALPELTVNTTPKKKRKQFTPKCAGSEPQSERRNPSRKARPPEHFGLEVEPVAAAKPRRIVEMDLKKLLEVDDDLRANRLTPKRKYRKRSSMRMPDDITEEELDNVADRAKDKILDKDNGSTCHQCRQKTLDTKTECRNPYCQGVKGQFCGPCLRNRYGEDVRTALLDPTWVCPLCRGICNCSLCRKRDGRCATGALTHLAKYNGYDNVKEYLESLQKNVD